MLTTNIDKATMLTSLKEVLTPYGYELKWNDNFTECELKECNVDEPGTFSISGDSDISILIDVARAVERTL